jgi:glycosyltransferase involved in cell wall biosynthesis
MSDPGDRLLPLSAVIITLNEERRLARCLESLRGLVSEIVVLDSGSTDQTRSIAEARGARVTAQPWMGNVAQKNAALGLATAPWVLSIDADETVSPELATSIRSAFANGDPHVHGFEVNLLNYYLGAWIHHAWYPQWRVRLARRAGAEWKGFDPHGRLTVRGRTTRLSGHLLHDPFADLQDHLRRSVQYGRTSADSYARAGRICRWHHLVFAPWAAFLKQLVVKQGWRDGWRGWVIAYVTMANVFAKYALLAELQGRFPPGTGTARPGGPDRHRPGPGV